MLPSNPDAIAGTADPEMRTTPTPERPAAESMATMVSLDEIAAWSRLDGAGKRAIWAEIEQRLAVRTGAA